MTILVAGLAYFAGSCLLGLFVAAFIRVGRGPEN